MIYLLALIPAIGWGAMPLITGKIGGSPVNQMFGIGAGASIVGIITYLITKPTVSVTAFWFSLAIGCLWTIGQVGQFISFKHMGVSNTMPLSSAFVLVMTSFVGIFFFDEWQGARALSIGLTACVVVIIGAVLTSISDGTSDKKVSTKWVLFLLVTTIGYCAYSIFPKMPQVAHESSQGIFLPEVLGILLGSVIYTICSGNAKAFKQKEQYLNILGGLSWGIGNFAYVFVGKALGVVTASIFGQMNVIISTFGGILLLHETKTKREMIYIVVGIILIVIGSILTVIAN